MKNRKLIISTIIVVMIALIPLVVFISTSKLSTKYAKLGNEQGLILNYCYVSMGCQTITDVTNYDVNIYKDKVVINIHLNDEFSDIETVKEFEISKVKSKMIETAIIRNGLLNLTEKDNEGCDGYYTTMTIYTDTKTKKIGGYLYDNKKYRVVSDLIKQLFGEEITSFIDDTQGLVDEAFENRYSNK